MIWGDRYVTMSQRARIYRVKAGVTLDQIAAEIGCDSKSIARFESGKRFGVTARIVDGYTSVFGISYDEFIERILLGAR